MPTPPAIAIDRRDEADRGRYVGHIDGVEGEAELLYTRRSAALLTADHAEAPMSMRGTGAALALVERMVSDARSEGFKILPRCSYVRYQFAQHPEWADVLAQ